MFVRRLRCFLLLLLAVFVSEKAGLHAQQPLLDAYSGDRLGWHYSLRRDVPRVVLLPGTANDVDERLQLARRLLRLQCNVYVPEMPSAFFSAHLSADSLVELARESISQIFSWDEPQTVILMGSLRGASVALLTALADFRVKAVVAVSPGEYFLQEDLVQKRMEAISIPILLLYNAVERQVVRDIVAGKKARSQVIFSGTLPEKGYKTLATSEAESGEAWLAISMFYSEIAAR